ncbi:MAG: hypothetical protein PHU00_08115 [Bacteroidales bacterium]|nr:hypothetical protein [Bacteroidales bacterium]
MKKLLLFSVLALYAILFTSCVESSKKYKALVAQMDSLGVASAAKNAEIEEVFATLNEVEEGLKSIREAENLLVLQSQKGGAEVTATSRERLKSDVSAIGEAISNYKNQIDKLKRDNRIQSDQFKKRLAAITQELEAKSQLVDDLSRQLTEKESQLKIKTQLIATLDQTVTNLRENVESLQKESTTQQETISVQDVKINTAFYITGTKDELVAANVMSKGGLFRSAKISYQAEQSAFIKIDIREVTDIKLNTKKAKVLSVHPQGSYTLEPDETGMLVLKISNPGSFWEHTKYLVIQNQ